MLPPSIYFEISIPQDAYNFETLAPLTPWGGGGGGGGVAQFILIFLFYLYSTYRARYSQLNVL